MMKHLIFVFLTFGIFFQIIKVERVTLIDRKGTLVDKNTYFKKKWFGKKQGIAKQEMPEMFGQIQRNLRTPLDRSQPEYRENYLVQEFQKAKKRAQKTPYRNELQFVSRGPGNIAGRTRALLIDPRDTSNSTWLAGAASGGIWRTEDRGKTWVNVSQTLTSLSTNTLAMSVSNPDIIYAGTGEHFVNDTDGNGMWKSEDGGFTWSQIASPSQYPGFKNVSRIIVDPVDAETVIVATSNGSWVDQTDYAIWKSVDGGTVFHRVYTSAIGRIDDLNANPLDFNVMYAAIQGFGIIKSIDGGDHWFESHERLNGVERIELDVSPVDTSRIWLSAEGGVDRSGSTIYLSEDSGQSFIPLDDENISISYLGGQGWYDNIITAHPYNADQVYIGGVNLFKINLLGGTREFIDFQRIELGTESFMDYVNSSFADESLVNIEDMLSVEIRFGQGSQKAHRFTVGLQGAAVPFPNYKYEDYVDVPFTVWDIENDRQLAVSFRDQNEDGEWDLVERKTNGDPLLHSRDYIFVHDISYGDSPSPLISRTGGVEVRLMYFIWPHLVGNTSFEQEDFPSSTLRIQKIEGDALRSGTTIISDAYQFFGGVNNFLDSNFINQNGLHPDQHNIVMVKENEAEETFRFVVTNDGGVYLSNESQNPGELEGDFSYAGFGYNTSQFYGADKAPGEERYIGGMQDNSTWFSPVGEDADSTTRYEFAIGGDGFEAVWNNANPAQLIGGSQFNNFARSLDYGRTWNRATSGFTDVGPFITRIANSKRLPERLYTVGEQGVWRSLDFGGNWELTEISSEWSFNNSADIEVSHADSNVIWAGGGLSNDEKVFVSKDAGLSFEAVNNYPATPLGFVSGIGTHPQDPATAYLLFSFAGRPKVIKTKDFGKTWEDISGFEGNGGVSDRGFPDVAIQSLLVFPNNHNRIWVGSEIGIIESMDGGLSWNLLKSNMPPVNIHEFKIQDDQVVIATYGRGIWTVDVEGIEQDFLLRPSVLDAAQFINGDLNMEYFLPSKYDSVDLFFNGEFVFGSGPNEKGSFSYVLKNDGFEGENTIEVAGYADGKVLFSAPYVVQLLTPGMVVTQYSNDFSDIAREDEFSTPDFRVLLENGFESEALHSLHPYPDAKNLVTQLRFPYLLTPERDNFMKFKEVVLVEPGIPGAVFGEETFWDYVVVEGSKDGQEWIAVEDGYDCNAHQAWFDRYLDFSKDGSSELYEERVIDLENTFEIGDTILLRFRLYADEFTNSWGWVIDDLEIGDISSSTNEVDLGSKYTILPNPVLSEFNIMSKEPTQELYLEIYNLKGRRMHSSQVNGMVDVSGLSPGTYFARVETEERVETLKFVKL